ncbi:hypothetical protein [Streptomyces longisporus]|uniref:Uncharacterized protein n=1 Tax=Streptomyces longisporus TaxID=1948 RepID=A0ABN3LNM8_STRLO
MPTRTLRPRPDGRLPKWVFARGVLLLRACGDSETALPLTELVADEGSGFQTGQTLNVSGGPAFL